MEIEVTCNTPDDVLFAQIEQNSRLSVPWLKSAPAHDGHAVIVGGGPSAEDWIDEIRRRQEHGQTIFALNNAAKWLEDRGIASDFVVVVDARPSNAAFIGHAKCELLSSQCHPSLFAAARNPILWHQEYPDDMARFDAALPPDHPAHTLIGGGTTVGLSAMVIAFALGYRQLHLYGYDSSYRDGATHAYAQTDPQRADCVATVAGRKFKTSLAMARQAELFPELADTLIDQGCTITIRGDGLLPWTSKISGPMAEHEKYTAMWDIPAYRKVAPGEQVADEFVARVGIKSSDQVIDFGCGTGRGAARIAEISGAHVHMMDFAPNCLDPDIKLGDHLTFCVADLAQGFTRTGTHGFCTDVMEHIPPEQVDRVIKNIMAAVQNCFFQISLVDDALGAQIGHPLHLSVYPASWWAETFRRLGFFIKWMDERDDAALFHVTH